MSLLALTLTVAAPTRAAEGGHATPPAAPLRPRPVAPALRSGDLVFQTSGSAQSIPIQRATGSPWSHVGLVEVAADGIYVLEAEATVVRTPWATFRNRGVGRRVLVMRARLDEAARIKVIAEATRHLGTPYDPLFGWGDDRVYCSELVVKAFQRGAGLELGRLEKLGDLNIRGLEPELTARYGRVPRELELVTPASLVRDSHLSVVVNTRDERAGAAKR
ncbi:MAG: YiiX/YebB-like N1pC/P60 family cysteine hydrolase [Anaeromyxobacter sp.]